MKPVEPLLEAGAQVQQMITAECIDDYTGKNVLNNIIVQAFIKCSFSFIDSPSMSVSFVYNNVPQKITMKLPLTLNKFFEPTEMNGESFFARWKNLGGLVITIYLFKNNSLRQLKK